MGSMGFPKLKGTYEVFKLNCFKLECKKKTSQKNTNIIWHPTRFYEELFLSIEALFYFFRIKLPSWYFTLFTPCF